MPVKKTKQPEPPTTVEEFCEIVKTCILTGINFNAGKKEFTDFYIEIDRDSILRASKKFPKLLPSIVGTKWGKTIYCKLSGAPDRRKKK